MIVEGTQDFLASINRLDKTEATKSKAFLLPFCDYLKSINTVAELVNMPLSNYMVFQDSGPAVDEEISRDEIYRIAFDNFNLFVSISGKIPKKCSLLYLISN